MKMLLRGRCICQSRGAGPLTSQHNARALPLARKVSVRQGRRGKEVSVERRGRSVFTECRKSCKGTNVACRAVSEVAVLDDEISASEEGLDDGMKRLHVTVPADKVSKAWQKAVKLEARSHDFPGFRQGKKIPDALVVQRVGKESVAQRAISILINDSLPIATKKYAPTAYEDSLILDTPADAAAKFDKDADFSYSCSLTLQPEVSWKGDYKKLKVESEAMPSDEIIRDMAEEKVKAGLKEVGSLRIVQNRGLETGDVAVIDIELRKKEDGELIEGSQQNGKQIDTAQAQHTVELPGFIDDIQGMVVGDRRELEYTLPETWWDPAMKGTQVICNVALKELFMWELPKLTDQVAKVLLPGSTDVKDFTEKVLAAEREMIQRLRVEELHSNVCKAVANLVDIDIPQFLFQTIGENEYQAELLTGQASVRPTHEMYNGSAWISCSWRKVYVIKVSFKGSLSKEEVEQLATEELLQKYMENRKDHLEDMVRVTVGMEAIWQEQDLSINEEDAKAELEAAMEEARQSGEKLDEERLAAQVYEAVKGTRIVEWLIEQGEVIEKPASTLAQLT